MSKEIMAFNPKALDTYGNKMLSVIVENDDAKAGAEQVLQEAVQREKIIDFELTRVALFLHLEEKIDLYVIYDEKKDTSAKLYRSILLETGVLKKVVGDEDITYDFTDKKLEGKFGFDETLKEKDETEFKARRSRRNHLNMRLQRVCKAAIALAEAKATHNDMQIKENEETKELEAILTKGPKEVMGKEGAVQIQSKSVAAVAGASATPTITGLGKVADNKHKAQPASRAETESASRTVTGDSADFTAIINAAIMAVKGKEGTVSQPEAAQLKNLLTEINKCVK